MIDFYDHRHTLNKLKDTLKTVSEAMGLEDKKIELEKLLKKQSQDGFWGNIEEAGKINKIITSHQKKINKVESLDNKVNELFELLELIEEMQDENEARQVQKELNELKKEVDNLRIEALLKGKYDGCNAILTIHAGAEERRLRTGQMLYRCIQDIAKGKATKSRSWTLDGDEAGIKSVTFEAAGENAYGFLKAEKGVHRLVRIAPLTPTREDIPLRIS